MTKHHLFKQGELKPVSEWKREGKPEHSDILVAKFNRQQALRFLGELARQLEGREGDDNFELMFAGKLEPYPES